jgi:peptidoglycan lytic transglycosylase A
MRAPAGRLLISLLTAVLLTAPTIDGAAARHHGGASPAARSTSFEWGSSGGRNGGRSRRSDGGQINQSKAEGRHRLGRGRDTDSEADVGAHLNPTTNGPRKPPPSASVTPDGHPSQPGPGPLTIPNAALEPARWDDLDGWADDDHASALATFQASCRPILRSSATNDSRPVRTALQAACGRAIAAGKLGEAAARTFFETNFRPVRIRKLGDAAGFLTGYYEPIVDGSRFPTREFTVPIYRRPPDLMAAGATKPGGPFPNSGRAYRRTASGELVPYYDRGEIEDGALDGRHLEICWLRSATEALFIQIEGSARIRLEDGTLLRINYDAHNGYPYVPVGRVLIDRNLVPREEMSMQRIRDWMQDNPDEAKDVRRQNRSTVFFRIVGLDDETEALGAEGIPLSAGRSIAVDKALHVYGTPFFIEADLPPASGPDYARFRRTMIAQDTGSAIVGPARADLYFGAGDAAGQIAGRIRQPGRFAMLVPRELDLNAAAAGAPLPPQRPALPSPRFASVDGPSSRLASGDRSAPHVSARRGAARFEFHRFSHRPHR